MFVLGVVVSGVVLLSVIAAASSNVTRRRSVGTTKVLRARFAKKSVSELVLVDSLCLSQDTTAVEHPERLDSDATFGYNLAAIRLPLSSLQVQFCDLLCPVADRPKGDYSSFRRRRLVPLATVLGLVLTLLGVLTSLAWFLGEQNASSSLQNECAVLHSLQGLFCRKDQPHSCWRAIPM